jgi:cytochrome P450
MSNLSVLMPEIDFAYDDALDLHERLSELRGHGPVVPVRYHGDRVWLILDHALLKQSFEDYVHFDPAQGYSLISGPSQGRTLQTMSGEEHRVSRGLVAPPFMPARIRALIEPLMEPIANELLDRIEGEHDVDFVPAFTRPYPFLIITRLLCIPVDDEAQLLEWAVKLIDFPWDPEGALKAKDGFYAYIQRVIDDRRAAPRDDFVSMLVQSEYEGERLSDERILSFLALLFPAGSDTSYKNAGSLFACVLADPALRERAMRSDKDREQIVTEALRWQPPTALLPRMASADVELGGVSIRKGDWTLFGITAANSDPAVFPDPRRFDPDRDNREMLTFGRSNHFCVGMHLARRELETALLVVLQRFPKIQLKADEPIEFVGAVLRGPRSLKVKLRPGDALR